VRRVEQRERVVAAGLRDEEDREQQDDPDSMMPRIAVRPVDTRTPMYVTPRRTSTMMATSSQYGGAKCQ